VARIKIGGYRLQIGGDLGPRRLKFTKNMEPYMVGSSVKWVGTAYIARGRLRDGSGRSDELGPQGAQVK
jgi:hypothetical protein